MKHTLSSPYSLRHLILFLAAALLLQGPGVFAGEIPYSTQNVIDLNFVDARSVETVDVDGDGDLDVVAVAQGNQDDVGWFENTAGDGSAWTERLITDGLTNPGWARVGDIDGDGDPDVIAADIGDINNAGKIVWLENTGSYLAAWPQITIATFNGVEPVEVGDLDGDGDLDVVASSFLLDDVVWYENTGAGATWATARKIDDLLKGKGLAIYDVDQDGDLDVGTAAPDGFARVDFGKVVWSENPGPAAIGAASSWTRHEMNTTLFDGARGLCFADFDLDGDTDAASAADGDGGQPDAIAVFENEGDNITFTQHLLDDEYLDPKVVFCFDLDEDGDMDLLSVSNGGDGVAWFENPRDFEAAWTRHTIQLVFTNGQNVWAGDIDGDGRLDVTAVSRNDMVSWWQNQEIQRNAAFPREEIADADHQGATGVALGDVDGDSFGEIVAASTTESKITAYTRDAAAETWSTLADVTTGLAGVQDVALGDTDRDGDLDVVASVDGATDGVRLFTNSGTGTGWSAANDLAGGIGGPRDLVLADIDGDGDLDAVVSAFDDDGYFFLANDGTDTFWPKTLIVDGDIVHDGAYGVAAADIDGDGDLDVLATAENDGEVLFYENTAGDGSTWALVTIDAAFAGARGVAAGDFDGDGDLDAVAAGSTNGDVSWWSNTAGDGSAWSETTIATSTAGGATGVAPVDLDGDGDLDVLVTEATDDAVAWYENTAGDGSTWSAHDATTSVLDGARGLATGDADRNGLVDVAAAGESDGDVIFLPNVGGQFALPTTDVSPASLGNSVREDLFSIEAMHNGLVGENDVELVALELLFEVLPSAEPMITAELQTIVDQLEVWLDDGDDIFEDGVDTLVTFATTPSVDADGVVSVSFSDGDPDAQIAQGSSETYFVVLETTADYTTAPLDSFRVTHRTQASSRGDDADRDTPLRLEGTTDETAGAFDVNPGGTPFADVRVLAIADTPDPVEPGGIVTYTVTVMNDGPWAAEDVSVAHTLPAGATLNSTSGCTNDPAASPCQLGTLRLEESAVFEVTITLPGDASGSVTYTATASTTTSDPTPANNSQDEITAVQPPTDLAISKSLGATGTTGNFTFVYTVVATNVGGADEPTATVTDNLPAQLLSPTWTCSGSGGASCPASGSGSLSETVNLPVDGRVTFTITGTVTATSGTMSNTASVAVAEDGNPDNDSSTYSLGLSGLLFVDGFESGDTSTWSSSGP